jgi:UDP-N-acetylmuramoyl-tripeptide--D-alanyl-D-alanine ligase
MTLLALAAALAAVAAAARHATRQRRLLHLLQLEHYENARLFVWLRRRRELLLVREAALAAAGCAALVAAAAAEVPALGVAAGVALAALMVLSARPDARRTELKPLVFTDRAKRLYAVALAFGMVPALALLVAALAAGAAGLAVVGAVAAVAACHAAPWLLAAANRALAPVQRRINERFVASARGRLAEWDPLVVGITGSYGKTTTKFCVGAVLAEDRPTLVTPESYNSYLGVVRTINERLEARHRAFVVEMGAYRRGDIAELCQLTRPAIGVLTAIGPVHLERHGSIEAIAAAKAELPEALPPGGRFVTNADDQRCRAIAARIEVPTTFFGLDSPDADVRAEGVAVRDGRTLFDLVVADERAPVRAKLLGRHNVANLLAAAAVGHVLGMPLDAIARGLGAVEAPDHRLQPIRNPAAGVVVIDDAYNANPAGARAALDVLAAHDAQRRILVTPGMVELGEMEEQLNREFGRQAGAVCDHVILVGPQRTRPIAAGLREAGLGDDAITVARDIHEATRVLHGLTRRGDVVLFENDLPDMYAEDGPRPAGGRAAA